jgi:hypothetical protein
LENRLHAAHCHGAPARAQFQFGRLWAGFRPVDAATITGHGPELEAASQRRGVAPQTLFRRLTRAHADYVLYPADWVSHEWKRVRAVFVDVGSFPGRQTMSITDPAVDLVGYSGAVHYDLYDSRFRERWRQDVRRDAEARADLAAARGAAGAVARAAQATASSPGRSMTLAEVACAAIHVPDGRDDAVVVVPATTAAAKPATAGSENAAVG